MGQCMHTLLERAATSAKVEERLYMNVNGWALSGQFDRLHVADKCLQDWKVTTCYKAKGDEAWTRQLNILRALAIHNGYDVQKLQVIAILRDWRRAEALRNPDYPQQNVLIIDVPVWDLEDTHAYIKERIALHQKAEEDLSVGCTDEERWYAGSTYALIKIGGKRATKVAPSREELGDPPKAKWRAGWHVIRCRPIFLNVKYKLAKLQLWKPSILPKISLMNTSCMKQQQPGNLGQHPEHCQPGRRSARRESARPGHVAPGPAISPGASLHRRCPRRLGLDRSSRRRPGRR